MKHLFTRDTFTISTDKSRLNCDFILKFLKTTYWGTDRTLLRVQTSIQQSVCFGVYDDNKQIGFARVLTDYVSIAHLLDVFIVPDYQGKGLGKWLMDCIVHLPEFAGVKTWILSTRDAHGLYRQYGFQPLTQPEKIMIKVEEAEDIN